MRCLRKLCLIEATLQELAHAGAEWINQYHSARKIVELQLECYRRFPGVATSEEQIASEVAI